MKTTNPLLTSIEESWSQVSLAWKKTERSLGSKGVHNLRVASRRLRAGLALLDAVVDDTRILKLRRQLKRLQRNLGGLRDVQVQRARSVDWESTAAVRSFAQTLKKKEQREGEDILQYLGGERKKKFRSTLKDIVRKADEHLAESDSTVVATRIREVVEARRDELRSAREHLVSSDPGSLHAVRMATKKVRYSLEGARPVLDVTPAAEMDRLCADQQLLGQIRDLQVLEKAIRRHDDADLIKVSRTLARQRKAQTAKFFRNGTPAA